MQDELFADSFGDISLTGSTVRIDLVSLSPSEKGADGQPALRFRQRVILPVEGFRRSCEAMTRMLRHLEDKNLVARESGARPASPAPPPPIEPPRVGGSGGSPNFPDD